MEHITTGKPFQEVKLHPTNLARLLRTDPGLIDRLKKQRAQIKDKTLNPFNIIGNLRWNNGGNWAQNKSNLQRITEQALQLKTVK